MTRANESQIPDPFDCRRLELDGTRYVILRESAFEAICQQAGVDTSPRSSSDASLMEGGGLDRASLAKRLVQRRRAAGLSQAELARRAGIRPETLNRIERGRTTPDFATIRKLVIAMNSPSSTPTQKEPDHAAAD